jgi:hypothetical protein
MSTGKILTQIEAINIVGRAIFNDDWVGEFRDGGKKILLAGLSDEDRKLIEDYGARPGKRGGLTIEPCPTEDRPRRDRAISRLNRIEAQRGAAADWLLDHHLVHLNGCDLDVVTTALACRPSEERASKVGAPPKFEAIALRMLADLNAGRQTRDSLHVAGKILANAYGADAKTCKKARDLALSSFS